ncbi:unnamed protein product [Pleuronectes platessa]|uniref:Uncharacterized protein n=1 Tax=Pleuronectes platessa TaxID=8262 RepID=A0A9N7ZD65_PLEPL|nr:unnamed protein product [Pleuronectes platessa]
MEQKLSLGEEEDSFISELPGETTYPIRPRGILTNQLQPGLSSLEKGCSGVDGELSLNWDHVALFVDSPRNSLVQLISPMNAAVTCVVDGPRGPTHRSRSTSHSLTLFTGDDHG